MSRRRTGHPHIGVGLHLLLILLLTGGVVPRTVSAAAATPATAGAGLAAAERTAIEALGERLIAAINATSDAERGRIVAEIFAADALARVGADKVVGQLARVATQLPDLSFVRAEMTEFRRPGSVGALHVYARQAGATMYRDLQLYVSDANPHRLTQLIFIAEVTEPIALPNGDITDEATLAWLNGYLDRLVAEYDLSGVALIAHGDSVIFERSFGFADAARKRPVTPRTAFSLASASKMFTALGIAKLVERGLLRYSDTIDRWFPDFPDPAVSRRVTIAHLLSHRSGIGEYWTAETAAALRSARNTAEVLPLVYRAGQRFEPGTQAEYSNSNFILAGLIQQQVSGKTYEDYIAGLITGPLRLADTGPFETADTKRALAEPLKREGDGWAATPRGVRGTAAGGWYSTPRDMLRFVRGLNAGRIVARATLDSMLVSRTADIAEADSDYGYGFIRQTAGGTASWGHGGIAQGINAEVRYFPGPDITLVIFSNQDNGAYDDLRKNATRLITGAR